MIYFKSITLHDIPCQTMNKFRKDTTISVSKSVKTNLKGYLPKKINLTGWVEEAITEKMLREQLQENPILERGIKEDDQCG